MTSLAPAWRCSCESLPGRSTWKAWWACLRVATLRPRATSTGISLTSRVVLPDPLQPTTHAKDVRAHRPGDLPRPISALTR